MANPTLRTPGIYVIRNIVTHRVYVGSSRNPQKRWSAHRLALNRGKHHSIYLQMAWNCHGPDMFAFEIVEYITEDAQLLPREQFWIDTLNAFITNGGMNACKYAGTNMRDWVFTDEHRAALSRAHIGRKHSEETKRKQREWHLGRPRSEATKEKLKTSRTGKKMSEDVKEKLRQINLGKKMPKDAIERTAASWRGRKHTPETILRMKEAALRRPKRAGRKPTPETILKIKASWAARRMRAIIRLGFRE